MGANKLAADLAGKPVIAHVVDAIHSAGLPRPIVVLGEDPEAIRGALAGRDVGYVTAPDHGDGMALSLAAGIAAAPEEWAAAIVCLGDMPLVTGELLRTMAERAGAASIVVPRFEGRRGNPVLWGRNFFPRLEKLTGDVGAKSLLAHYADRIDYLDWADDSIRIDIDRPEELALARRRLGG
jgi:molybdenum cofactor cytidylyltransferase